MWQYNCANTYTSRIINITPIDISPDDIKIADDNANTILNTKYNTV